MTVAIDAPTRSGRWSVSAAQAWWDCPLRAQLRYGPHAVTADRQSTGDDVHRRRGIVLHEALRVALDHARIEGARPDAIRLTGARMSRYYGPARIELGQAWLRHRMPSDPAEAQRVVDMFTGTLAAVPVPRPGAIVSIEQEHDVTLPSGIALRFIADYVWWSAPGVLRIVDWKSRRLDPDEVRWNPQLHCYGMWLAAMIEGVERVELELFSMRDALGHVVELDPAKGERAVARVDRAAQDMIDVADGQAPPRPGAQCAGCWVRDQCPAIAQRP